MAVQRKRFRIEEFQAEAGDLSTLNGFGGDVIPFHHEIMNELRAIRAQMAAPHSAGIAGSEVVTPKQSEEAKLFLKRIARRSNSAKN